MSLIFKTYKVERIEADSIYTVHLYLTDTETNTTKELILFEDSIKYILIDDLDNNKKIHINMGNESVEIYMNRQDADIEEKYNKLLKILTHK